MRNTIIGAFLLSVVTALLSPGVAAAEQPWIVYDGKAGPGQGKHIVLLAGDEEYRSEEALPMLGKVLSQRHGFKCTVLFSVDENGVIDPNRGASLTHPEALDSADLIVMSLRFRKWPDADMKHFVDAYRRGVPIVALRTSTHAFQLPASSVYKDFSAFGERVLGEEWVSHWGRHKVEATLGIIEPSAKDEPILRGVKDVFGDTDVYEAYPPADAKILLRGQVLKGMKPTDPPADYTKRRASDKAQQGVNDPMMPVAWTRVYANEAGKQNRIFCTTLGSATDLQNEGARRLVVNAVYWGLGLDVPGAADVAFVDDFQPTMYGFGSYRRGIRASDHALGKVLQAGTPAEPARPRPAAPPAPPKPTSSLPLKLNKGDHVALIGNALGDRMQHSGFFETLVHAKHPQHELVFRNLAVAGDEIVTRHRSENFGTPDDWLNRTRADVILAFFGFNESFKGREGLEKFKADLDQFLKVTLAKNYSGKGAPRVVLFSPIANERHRDPNFPDPTENNARIREYTAAMDEVSRANGVPLINLYAPSERLYAAAARQGASLTVNGLHLTENGDGLLAPAIFEALFGEAAPTGDFEKLRGAVNQKNWQWHQRYRTMDGYNVYGGRSNLSFEASKGGTKITNYQIMQEEMSQRDVLTANRDKRVWAVAQGGEWIVDDSNLPPVTKIQSNRPGPNPDGTHTFLSGEEAMAKMKVHSGMKVNLYASEDQFPDLINPVQMAWDTKGRLWVAVWPNYPERTPDSKVGDKLLIFEDTNGDGKADKQTIFLDDLNCPTGFQFYKDGVLLVQAPDVWFVRDTDGDGRGDWKERVLMGLDSADSHHTANAVCLDPGGSIYLSDGVFHRTQVETAIGPVRNNDAAIFRFEPRTGKFETYISYGFANPHGRLFDYWGNDLVTDATGNNTYFGPAFSGFLDYPAKHPNLRQFWNRPSRPCPATGMISSRHFPEEFQGNFLNLNVIGFLGVFRVAVTEDGSGLTGETKEHLISSEDPNFRPIAISIGADGAIYFADWHNPIIGHMQHHIRDPNRDHAHGRLYRITYEGRPLLKPAKIHGEPIPALLELLKEPENGTRELAKVELGARDTREVLAAAKKWAAALDRGDKDYEHHMMEALWLHQWHNVVDADLLRRMLSSPDHRARAAATRVLCYWRDRVPDVLAILKKQAADEHPRVRLEAVRAASFFRTAEAAGVALTALEKPTDYYLDYTMTETLRQLEPYWRKAISDGQIGFADSPKAVDYLVRKVNTAELLKLPRTEAVQLALLSRPDVQDAVRQAVLDSLATLRKASKADVLLGVIESTGSRENAAAAALGRLLVMQNPDELKAQRDRVARLTSHTSSADLRQAGWMGLVLAGNAVKPVWTEAAKNPKSLADFLAGLPILLDQDLRIQAYGRVKPLLNGVPAELTGGSQSGPGVRGRYVRIELPDRGTLTLAEVEVYSEGKNVARGGRARQSTTSNDGAASRAIDGRTDGSYGSGTQTHTQENSRNPWWEVDLRDEYPIEAVVVWNRTDGELGQRLNGYTLKVLDGDRREVYQKAGNPAPAASARIEVSSDLAGTIRRAAIYAAVSIPHEQEGTFQTLAGLVEKGEEVPAAAQAMRLLPRASWPKDRAGATAVNLVAWARKTPVERRTAQDFIETVQIADDLAGFLPGERATALRRDLRELRVSVFVIRTVLEQMRFDTPRIVVEAGKPFEIVLENIDFMPHNLAVMKPGAREKLGPIAETMKPDDLDSEGRPFLPKSDAILAATRLLERGQRQTLKLTAPDVEGDYEYVCTFPGHWQVMWGSLIVTKDVDAYLQKHPSAPERPAAAAHHHE